MVREQQITRLQKIKAKRDGGKVHGALEALTTAARTGQGNLLDLAIQAMRLRATVGEVSDALEKVFRAPSRRYAKGDRCVCSCL
jgi:methylmalonyl-CoA mutase